MPRAACSRFKLLPSLYHSARVSCFTQVIPRLPASPAMDRIIPPHSPEAAAHNHLQENWFSWDLDNINESLVSNCASYSAFDRYISGADLYIVPRTQADLENILKRYSYDAIHNAIAKSRSTLQPGGYSRVCVLAEKSIRGILNSGDNVNFLLSLHRRDNKTSSNDNGCTTQVILTEW